MSASHRMRRRGETCGWRRSPAPVPDAHLAALLRQHGVSILYTLDRNLYKFAFLDVRDPFVRDLGWREASRLTVSYSGITILLSRQSSKSRHARISAIWRL